MKNLIIIEGMDRTGKDTIQKYITNKLEAENNEILNFHRTGPKNKGLLGYLEQKNIFLNDFFNIKNYKEEKENTYFIFNRSYIGEYVYSPLYRGFPAEWILDLDKCVSEDTDFNTYLILLYGEPEFLFKNDDNKSLSKGIETHIIEDKLFKEIFNKSLIKNKLLLKVCDDKQYFDFFIVKLEIDKFLNL